MPLLNDRRQYETGTIMKYSPNTINDCKTAYLKLFDMFDKVGVPPEFRWRSLLLFFREIKDYHGLTDAQRIAVQALMSDILKNGDYSEKRLEEILIKYYDIQVQPYKNQIDCLAREATSVMTGFKKLLSSRNEEIKNFEEESVSIVSESMSSEEAIDRLRQAFCRMKKLFEADINNFEKIAMIDEVTRITNRRGFDQFMRIAINAWLTSGRLLYLAMLDIDHFKQVNDKYGHRVGDQMLAVVGSHLKKAMQKFSKNNTVLAARYGGEEFALVVSGPDAPTLPITVKKCCESIKNFNLLLRDADGNIVKNDLCITISAGVTTISKRWQRAHFEHLIDNADKALYYAKSSGRDATVEFRPDKKEAFSLITLPDN